jgi:alpha-L-fucosidase
MFAQIRELLSNYGKIDLKRFDGGWERKPEQWQAKQLHEMIRSLQPHLLINDRLPGFGDFDTCFSIHSSPTASAHLVRLPNSE